MPVKELRDLAPEELAQKEGELREEIFRLRLRRGTSQLENPMKLRETRRELARVCTLMREREEQTA